MHILFFSIFFVSVLIPLGKYHVNADDVNDLEDSVHANAQPLDEYNLNTKSEPSKEKTDGEVQENAQPSETDISPINNSTKISDSTVTATSLHNESTHTTNTTESSKSTTLQVSVTETEKTTPILSTSTFISTNPTDKISSTQVNPNESSIPVSTTSASEEPTTKGMIVITTISTSTSKPTEQPTTEICPQQSESSVVTWAIVLITLLIAFAIFFTFMYFLRKYLLRKRRADRQRLLGRSQEGFFMGNDTEHD